MASTPSPRDTGWKRDPKGARGIRRRVSPTSPTGFAWGHYDTRTGKTVTDGPRRKDAIDAQARARVDTSKGLPAPDTRVLIRDLAAEVREIKARKLRNPVVDLYAIDKIIVPELGHLKPSQVGPDRLARLVRDLEEQGMSPASIRRYLVPLTAIFKLAIRRGIVHTSPMALLSNDERPTGGGQREHRIWSTEEISRLISKAEELGSRSDARYDYAPLIRLLVLTGLRVGEALALRKADVDLLGGVLRVEHSGGRKGAELSDPKTEAGKREVPLSVGVVSFLAQLIPADAAEDDFVFHAKGNPKRPMSCWNFRSRGFAKALEAAGLDGQGITIHSLRSAAASLYAARGVTDVELATLLGHADANITRKVYTKLFDPKAVHEEIRAAQDSISGERAG
jgi:integrase